MKKKNNFFIKQNIIKKAFEKMVKKYKKIKVNITNKKILPANTIYPISGNEKNNFF